VARERVESLEATDRELLELGSVFGPVFWVGGVLSMSRPARRQVEPGADYWKDDGLKNSIDAQLLQLESQDLIAYRAESGLPSQTAYAFANPIEQQKIYSNIPVARRKNLHSMAAQWLNIVAPAESFQLQEIVAWHYEASGNEVGAARAYFRAGKLALGSYQNYRACDLFRRAIDLLDESNSRDLCLIYCELADTHLLLGQHGEADTACQQLLYYSRVVSLPIWAARAYLRIGRIGCGQGRYDHAMDALDGAHRLFEESASLDGVADCLDEVGKIHWYRGANASYRDALSCFMKSLSLRRKSGAETNIALSLSLIGNIHLARGHVEEAHESFQEALLIRRVQKDRWGLAHTLVGMGAVHFECRRVGDAQKVWQEGLALATEVGDRELCSILQNNLGELHLTRGNQGEAERLLGRAYDAAVDMGDRRTQADCLRNKARLAAMRGHWDRALMLSGESEEMAQSTGGKHILGACLLNRGEILALIVQNDAASLVKSKGDIEKEASEAFQRARTYFEEMGNTVELGRTLKAYGDFLQERGVGNKARKVLAQAKKLLSAFSSQA
jgi:tetratricopeptide (TPR) repeat protein